MSGADNTASLNILNSRAQVANKPGVQRSRNPRRRSSVGGRTPCSAGIPHPGRAGNSHRGPAQHFYWDRQRERFSASLPQGAVGLSSPSLRDHRRCHRSTAIFNCPYPGSARILRAGARQKRALPGVNSVANCPRPGDSAQKNRVCAATHPQRLICCKLAGACH